MTSSNPLIGAQAPLPFDHVRPEHIAPAVEKLIGEARARLDEIADLKAVRTYENTMAALDRATDPLDLAVAIVRHLEAVATNPELRGAWNAVQPEVIGFYSGIPLHAGLWKALKEFEQTAGAKSLAPVRARFLKKTIDAFRRHGAELDDEGKKKMEALDVELAIATTKFAQNVVDSTMEFEYYIEDEKQLAGLPPSAVGEARQSAESKGKPGWRFTLQAPSYLAVMTYLADAEVRRKFFLAYNRRAAAQNPELIARILDLRQQKAAMLGFSNFADFVLNDRMAHDGATAQRFERDLQAKTEPYFRKENEGLLAFRRSVEGEGAGIEPWDVAFWSEKQRAAEYDFEEEDLRPYFPVNQVIDGMFELVRRLYGIKVTEGPAVPLWHPDVKYYQIHDQDGTLLGCFYADWHPRETKRGGAWMDAFLTGYREGDAWVPHIGLICGNLTPPLAQRPALLTHREVETIFHEFGHLLHHCLSRVEVKSLAGTSVAWDFVELPSQIMENWCWERESLDLFARHWQTGETIPEELYRKMVRARTFRGANAQMRQLGLGSTDLALHIDYRPEKDGDVIGFSNRLLSAYAPAKLPQGYAMLASFTHLFADAVGYGAGYYSYKWAEVLEADAFTRFKREGVFNPETGRNFRSCILEKGDSQEPAELFRCFMGRDPDSGALLERLGLR